MNSVTDTADVGLDCDRSRGELHFRDRLNNLNGCQLPEACLKINPGFTEMSSSGNFWRDRFFRAGIRSGKCCMRMKYLPLLRMPLRRQGFRRTPDQARQCAHVFWPQRGDATAGRVSAGRTRPQVDQAGLSHLLRKHHLPRGRPLLCSPDAGWPAPMPGQRSVIADAAHDQHLGGYAPRQRSTSKQWKRHYCQR